MAALASAVAIARPRIFDIDIEKPAGNLSRLHVDEIQDKPAKFCRPVLEELKATGQLPCWISGDSWLRRLSPNLTRFSSGIVFCVPIVNGLAFGIAWHGLVPALYVKGSARLEVGLHAFSVDGCEFETSVEFALAWDSCDTSATLKKPLQKL